MPGRSLTSAPAPCPPPYPPGTPPAALPAAGPHAYSASTERALRSDLALFRAWCAARGAVALPARAETVAAYVDAMAAVRAPSTVRRYVASIAAAHRAAGRTETIAGPHVAAALRRMHHRRGRRQRQAHGLTWALRQRLSAAVGDRLIDLRNRALLAVAYDGMLRRSELTALRVPDLAAQPRGGASLLVRRAKTDPEGQGQAVYIARDSLAVLQDWLRSAGIADGRLFRSVRKDGAVGGGLDPSQVPRIYKAMARAAGLPGDIISAISGHSPRVGAAQDMIAHGIELPAILQAGRWKTTTMVSRYGERLLAQTGGAARLARLQKRD